MEQRDRFNYQKGEGEPNDIEGYLYKGLSLTSGEEREFNIPDEDKNNIKNILQEIDSISKGFNELEKEKKIGIVKHICFLIYCIIHNIKEAQIEPFKSYRLIEYFQGKEEEYILGLRNFLLKNIPHEEIASFTIPNDDGLYNMYLYYIQTILEKYIDNYSETMEDDNISD